MSFPGLISCGRAIVEAYMRGENNDTIMNQSFFLTSNKYGLDNPVASVTKRIAWYGNTEDLQKQIEDLYLMHGSDFKFDKDVFIPQEQKKTDGVLFGGELRLRDMNELNEQLKSKKKAGAVDIRLLAIDKPEIHLNPAEKILARSVKLRVFDLD